MYFGTFELYAGQKERYYVVFDPFSATETNKRGVKKSDDQWVGEHEALRIMAFSIA